MTENHAASDSLATSAAQASQNDNIGQWIINHISNSNEWHIPWLHVYLPKFEPFQFLGITIDLSISNHLVMLWIAALIILLLFRSVKAKNQVQSGLAMFLETIVVFVRDEIAVANMGNKFGKKFTPLLVSFFLFIWVANLMGLIPLFSTATGNVNVTFSLAVITFLLHRSMESKNRDLFIIIQV